MITFTDKDSKVVICKPETYVEAAKGHLDKDEKVDWNLLQPTEKLLNKTATKLASIFRIGESGTSNQCDRVNKLVKERMYRHLKYLSYGRHTRCTRQFLLQGLCNATRGPIARSADFLWCLLQL